MGTVRILESSSVAVRRDQVEIDGEKARVRLVKTKGNTDRYVRIPLTLLENIEEEYTGSERVYLFENHHGQHFMRQYVTW